MASKLTKAQWKRIDEHYPSGWRMDIEEAGTVSMRMVRGVLKLSLDDEEASYFYHGREIRRDDVSVYDNWRVGGYRNGQSFENLAEARAYIDRLQAAKALAN